MFIGSSNNKKYIIRVSSSKHMAEVVFGILHGSHLEPWSLHVFKRFVGNSQSQHNLALPLAYNFWPLPSYQMR